MGAKNGWKFVKCVTVSKRKTEIFIFQFTLKRVKANIYVKVFYFKLNKSTNS